MEFKNGEFELFRCIQSGMIVQREEKIRYGALRNAVKSFLWFFRARYVKRLPETMEYLNLKSVRELPGGLTR